MKIQLLFAGLLISGSAALAQTVSTPVAITNSNTESDIIGKATKPSTNHSSAAAIGNGQIDEVVIGTTLYDLQTNNAVQPRFILHANGSMSAAWTMSQDDAGGAFTEVLGGVCILRLGSALFQKPLVSQYNHNIVIT